jgi:hypothetical protein
MQVNLEYVYNKIMYAEKLESRMDVLLTDISDEEDFAEEHFG